ncbi:MAG: VOC family protein [Lentisphaeraceae bacterium]|nr:VOC family protein [Lentisphaeraceae bacterium]
MLKNLFIALCIAATASCSNMCNDEESKATDSQFSKTTIDLGIVVSDINKSVKFYEDVLGFKEISTFVASPQVAGDAGLLDYKQIKVHVLSLDGDKQGTKVKLMQATKPAQKQNQKFIDSTYGISYITIFVKDMTPIVKKLAAHKASILVKGPVDLSPGKENSMFLACVKDPDGNFIEFVGPKSGK